MSNTEKVHARFWTTMTERYGTRWTTIYGTECTRAWRDCMRSFTPKDVNRAIEALDLKESTRQHPPTEPEFRALLKIAARGNAKHVDDPTELRRGYWRSCIVTYVSRGLGYGYDPQLFELVLIANKTLGVAMRDLLNDLDELEADTGQRTPGQEAMCMERCTDIVAAFKELKALTVAA